MGQGRISLNLMLDPQFSDLKSFTFRIMILEILEMKILRAITNQVLNDYFHIIIIFRRLNFNTQLRISVSSIIGLKKFFCDEI